LEVEKRLFFMQSIFSVKSQ